MDIRLRAIYEFNEDEYKEVRRINGERDIPNYDMAVVAENDEKMLGYTLLFYKPCHTVGYHNAYIKQMNLDKDLNDTQVATKMYEYTYKHLGDCKYLIAYTGRDRVARNFYESCGFEKATITGVEYYIKPIGGNIMKTFFHAEEEKQSIGEPIKR